MAAFEEETFEKKQDGGLGLNPRWRLRVSEEETFERKQHGGFRGRNLREKTRWRLRGKNKMAA